MLRCDSHFYQCYGRRIGDRVLDVDTRQDKLSVQGSFRKARTARGARPIKSPSASRCVNLVAVPAKITDGAEGLTTTNIPPI